MRDTIAVAFENDKFTSCALMSKIQALVFTQRKAIYVCLKKQFQKVLEYPQGIENAFHSLNLMKIEPKMFIVANIDCEFEQEIL